MPSPVTSEIWYREVFKQHILILVISLFQGDTRILATGFSAVAQGQQCPSYVACMVCHLHLGSGDPRSQRRGGTARCPASSG